MSEVLKVPGEIPETPGGSPPGVPEKHRPRTPGAGQQPLEIEYDMDSLDLPEAGLSATADEENEAGEAGEPHLVEDLEGILDLEAGAPTSKRNSEHLPPHCSPPAYPFDNRKLRRPATKLALSPLAHDAVAREDKRRKKELINAVAGQYFASELGSPLEDDVKTDEIEAQTLAANTLATKAIETVCSELSSSRVNPREGSSRVKMLRGGETKPELYTMNLQFTEEELGKAIATTPLWQNLKTELRQKTEEIERLKQKIKELESGGMAPRPPMRPPVNWPALNPDPAIYQPQFTESPHQSPLKTPQKRRRQRPAPIYIRRTALQGYPDSRRGTHLEPPPRSSRKPPVPKQKARTAPNSGVQRPNRRAASAKPRNKPVKIAWNQRNPPKPAIIEKRTNRQRRTAKRVALSTKQIQKRARDEEGTMTVRLDSRKLPVSGEPVILRIDLDRNH